MRDQSRIISLRGKCARLVLGALLAVGTGVVALQATASQAAENVAVKIYADHLATPSVSVNNNGSEATCYPTPDGNDLDLQLAPGKGEARAYSAEGCSGEVAFVSFDLNSDCADKGGSLSVDMPSREVICFLP